MWHLASPTPIPAALTPESLYLAPGAQTAPPPPDPWFSPNTQAGTSQCGEMAGRGGAATPHEGQWPEQSARQPPGHRACPPRYVGQSPDSTQLHHPHSTTPLPTRAQSLEKVTVLFSDLQHPSLLRPHVGSSLAVPQGTHNSLGQGQGLGIT